MSKSLLGAIIFIAASAVTTGATAQNTYKCGNVYSQTPCAGGVTLDVNDARSPEQRAQATSTAQSTAKTADSLEKTRLKQEALNANAMPRPVQVAAANVTEPPTRSAAKSVKKSHTPKIAAQAQSGDKAAVKPKPKKNTAKPKKATPKPKAKPRPTAASAAKAKNQKQAAKPNKAV